MMKKPAFPPTGEMPKRKIPAIVPDMKKEPQIGTHGRILGFEQLAQRHGSFGVPGQ
jgi:hypothetical protein